MSGRCRKVRQITTCRLGITRRQYNPGSPRSARSREPDIVSIDTMRGAGLVPKWVMRQPARKSRVTTVPCVKQENTDESAGAMDAM